MSQVSAQAKISFFKNPHIKINRLIIIIIIILLLLLYKYYYLGAKIP